MMHVSGAAARRAALAVALSSAALSSAVAADEQRFGDWLLRCAEQSGREECHITQTVQMADRDINVFAVAVFFRPAQTVPTVAFRVPPETVPDSQLAIRVDEGEPLAIPVARCGKDYCETTAKLREDVEAQFRRGAGGVAIFVLQPETRVAVNFSLKGFTAAFNALKDRAKS